MTRTCLFPMWLLLAVATTPVLGKIVDVTSINRANCVVFDSGKSKCFGYNGNGRLGIGSPQPSFGGEPGEMQSLPAVMVGDSEKVVRIAGSGAITCALLAVNQVKCWGTSSSGQEGEPFMRLGFLTKTPYVGRRLADMNDHLPYVPINPKGEPLKDVATNGSRTCVAFESGRLKCWGRNGNGSLGLETEEPYPTGTPEKMAALGDVNLGSDFHTIQVSMPTNNFDRSCAVSQEGSVKCWGTNTANVNGEPMFLLGIESKVDFKGSLRGDMGRGLHKVELGTGEKALKVYVTAYNSCVLLASGKIKCWGNNTQSSLLGLNNANFGGPNTMGDQLPVVNLGTDYVATDLSCANEGSLCCAVLNREDTKNGMKCWGSTSIFGQLGQGDKAPRGSSIDEMGDDLNFIDLGSDVTNISRISASESNVCALFDDGRLKCWGSRYYGALTEIFPQVSEYEKVGVGDEPGEMGDNLPYLTILE